MYPVRSSLLIFFISLTHAFSSGMPVADGAKNAQENALVMLLGTALDPSTILGKTAGILDTSLQKLNINSQELQQLQSIYASFGDAIALTMQMTGDQGNSGAEDFAAQLAMSSDAMERTFDAQRQQAKALGMDPSSLNAMRELNNQSIRNYAFTQVIKTIKKTTGQNMTLTDRLALSNVLNGLKSDQLNQQLFNDLIAASISAYQNERRSQDLGLAGQIVSAMGQISRFAKGEQVDPSLDLEAYAPPATHKPTGDYSYQGSRHVNFSDYQNAAAGITQPSQPPFVPSGAPGQNQTATFTGIQDRAGNADLATGMITVNGRQYAFKSGGFDRGYLPPGTYTISDLQLTSQRGMVAGRGTGDQFGFKAFISDKYDSRVGGTRSLLRIHPDEGLNGTQGCIGIQGDAAMQRQFYNDLKTEIDRNGGSFSLTVG